MTATLSQGVPTKRPGGSYVFANAKASAAARLTLLTQIFDPITQAALERVEIAAGWSCWEIGAGSGTIATWLRDRVGARGHVLATDIDPRFLEPLAGANLEVQPHDVISDPLPGDRFDLIHARLLLCHLPQREAVLDRIISALKPGGWLVVEDFDSLSVLADQAVNPVETPLETFAAMRELMRQRGIDMRFARLLSGKLRARGLTDVSAEGRMFMSHSGSAFARFQQLTLFQLRGDLIGCGLVTQSQFDQDMARLEEDYAAPSPTFWSVAGRRTP